MFINYKRVPIGMLNSQMVCGTDGMLKLLGMESPHGKTVLTCFDPDQDHEHPLVMEKNNYPLVN